MLSQMAVQPSEAELYNIFTDEVRKYKPMSKVWEFMDLGMLPGLNDPPTYGDYHRLCWEFLDREAKQRAKYALLGRSQPANQATKPKSGPANVPVGAGQSHGDPAAAVPYRAQNQMEADKKLAKEKGWCIPFFSKGSCSRGAGCPYTHTKNRR